MGWKNEMMRYYRINEDYFDDIEKDDVISRIEDDDKISYDYMVDIPMPEKMFKMRVRRLERFLSSMLFVKDFDIAVVHNGDCPDRDELFGKYSERIEEIEPHMDGLYEYSYKWRIRFNINKLRFDRLLKFLRELVCVADGYYHAGLNNTFCFVLYDGEVYLHKIDLMWIIAVTDNRVRYELSRGNIQLVFVVCLHMIELFGCDYAKSMSYLIERFGFAIELFRTTFTNFCPTVNNMSTSYMSAELASRLGMENFIKTFEKTSISKAGMKILCESGKLRLFQAKLNNIDKQTFGILSNSLQKQLEVNEYILDYVPDNFNIIEGDVRLQIKSTDSRYVHLMFLGCFDVEGETSALIAMLTEPIKGRRGILAAMKRIIKDYELLGQSLRKDDISIIAGVIEEQFSL